MKTFKRHPLDKLGSFRSGYSLRTKIEPINPDDATHWLIPMRAIFGIQKYQIDWNKIQPIQLEESDKYQKYLAEDGDLLLSLRGDFKAIHIEQPPEKILIHNNWTMFTANKNVNAEYIAWWFNHPKIQQRFFRVHGIGSAIPFLSLKDLEQFKVPLPPPETQKKIVELQSLQERELELMEKLQVLRTQLINALMTQVLDGE